MQSSTMPIGLNDFIFRQHKEATAQQLIQQCPCPCLQLLPSRLCDAVQTTYTELLERLAV